MHENLNSISCSDNVRLFCLYNFFFNFQSEKLLLHKNMSELRNVLHDLTSYEEITNISITSSISLSFLENHLKLLQVYMILTFICDCFMDTY